MDNAISFSINRLTSSRTRQEKNEQEEMLAFTKVYYDDRKYVSFDVFLIMDKNVNTNELNKAEFAESYTSLPHVHTDNNTSSNLASVTFQRAITELLEDNT
ncbi:Catechol oxidase B, chloroplastic [Capsicum chinense]|nr:Catechol oxidase B, chloroplastic [Capsicum chinense]